MFSHLLFLDNSTMPEEVMEIDLREDAAPPPTSPVVIDETKERELLQLLMEKYAVKGKIRKPVESTVEASSEEDVEEGDGEGDTESESEDEGRDKKKKKQEKGKKRKRKTYKERRDSKKLKTAQQANQNKQSQNPDQGWQHQNQKCWKGGKGKGKGKGWHSISDSPRPGLTQEAAESAGYGVWPQPEPRYLCKGFPKGSWGEPRPMGFTWEELGKGREWTRYDWRPRPTTDWWEEYKQPMPRQWEEPSHYQPSASSMSPSWKPVGYPIYSNQARWGPARWDAQELASPGTLEPIWHPTCINEPHLTENPFLCQSFAHRTDLLKKKGTSWRPGLFEGLKERGVGRGGPGTPQLLTKSRCKFGRKSGSSG